MSGVEILLYLSDYTLHIAMVLSELLCIIHYVGIAYIFANVAGQMLLALILDIVYDYIT